MKVYTISLLVVLCLYFAPGVRAEGEEEPPAEFAEPDLESVTCSNSYWSLGLGAISCITGCAKQGGVIACCDFKIGKEITCGCKRILPGTFAKAMNPLYALQNLQSQVGCGFTSIKNAWKGVKEVLPKGAPPKEEPQAGDPEPPEEE